MAVQFEQDESVRTEVLSQIEDVDISHFEEAFANLPTHEYVRYTRTEQFDDEDFMVAFRERTVKHSGPMENRQFDVVSADSSGNFDFGFFRRFVSANVQNEDPGNLAPYLFPEDPAYLSERNFEAYLYRIKPDTMMGQTAARVVEIRARPVEGDGKNIRRAQYFFDKNTDQLIAFRLERIDLALFFREESVFYAHIQPGLGDSWVPYNTRFETRILMPFKPMQRFRTVATYAEVGRRESGSPR